MTEYRDQQAALVLAWDGEPVPEGCDRAVRPLRGWAVAGVGGADRLMYTYTIEEAVEIARACEYTHLGTAVVVEAPDAGGEGT